MPAKAIGSVLSVYKYTMIELKNVTKTYPGGICALKDVDLQIADREFVFIVGGSGAGKSALAKLLIAEEKPTSGYIAVGEWELSALKKKQVPYYRRKLGIVFRDFRLFTDKTVYENVAFALRVIGENFSSIRMKVNAALRMVELSDKSKCYPAELTVVEQQRVALARALAGSPELIIADEPTGNTDPVQSRELMELFGRIHSRYNKTVVILTHDKELALSFGMRTVCMTHGQIVEDIAANRSDEELLAEPQQTEENEGMERADTAVSADTEVFAPILLSGEGLSMLDTDYIEPAEFLEEPEAATAEPEAVEAEAEVASTTPEAAEDAPEVAEATLEAALEAVAEEAPEAIVTEAVWINSPEVAEAVASATTETIPGAEVQSMTISTDALEAVLADLLLGITSEEKAVSRHDDTSNATAESALGEQEEQT